MGLLLGAALAPSMVGAAGTGTKFLKSAAFGFLCCVSWDAALQIGQVLLQIINGLAELFNGARKLIELMLNFYRRSSFTGVIAEVCHRSRRAVSGSNSRSLE